MLWMQTKCHSQISPAESSLPCLLILLLGVPASLKTMESATVQAGTAGGQTPAVFCWTRLFWAPPPRPCSCQAAQDSVGVYSKSATCYSPGWIISCTALSLMMCTLFFHFIYTSRAGKFNKRGKSFCFTDWWVQQAFSEISSGVDVP